MSAASLYIASVLAPEGETGVQTHFRVCAELAKSNGVEDVRVITPYAMRKIIRGPLHRIAKTVGLYSRELGILCNRYFWYLLMFHQLSFSLRRSNGRVVIYAQDPLSAKAALKVKRRGGPIEIVLAVHFNISEAWEVIKRGVASDGGVLCRHYSRLENDIIHNVDRIIFVSRFMEKTVMERLPQVVSVPEWVIPNAITGIEPSAKSDITGDVITIGTVEPRKNQQFLVRVLSEAHRLGFKYSLTVVGDGESRNELATLVKNLGLKNYVTFTGYVPNAGGLIRRHRVYVHGALMENFPISLVEALASSKPVLAFPFGGIPEVFDDGVEGFYWNGDPVVAAQQLINLLEDDKLYQKTCTAARRRYEHQFRSDVVGSILLEAVLGKLN